MASSREDIFDISGPVHLLTCFDWKNSFHRRSLAASLVEGVYISERDRQHGRIEQDGNAPPWWERFHFKLHKVLQDDEDLSYFGAIFELKQTHHDWFFHQSRPRYVIAFRGTMTGHPTIYADMKLNIEYTLDMLEKNPRFHAAFEAVRSTTTMKGVGPTKVWIAGHSLGASIAMVVGRNMAKSGYQLETYLFNPPFITVLPLEVMTNSETLKTVIRIAGSVLKAGIARVLNHHGEEDQEEDPFSVLSAWTPHVFVNQKDPICTEYIAYFEHREKMEGTPVGKIERIATRYSIGSLVSGALVGRKAEPYHRLPTAYITVNTSHSENIKEAHGNRQWWQDHSQWQSKLYKFK